jgi:hypothetical protein
LRQKHREEKKSVVSIEEFYKKKYRRCTMFFFLGNYNRGYTNLCSPSCTFKYPLFLKKNLILPQTYLCCIHALFTLFPSHILLSPYNICLIRIPFTHIIHVLHMGIAGILKSVLPSYVFSFITEKMCNIHKILHVSWVTGGEFFYNSTGKCSTQVDTGSCS